MKKKGSKEYDTQASKKQKKAKDTPILDQSPPKIITESQSESPGTEGMNKFQNALQKIRSFKKQNTSITQGGFERHPKDSQYQDSALLSPNDDGEESKRSSQMSSRRSTIFEEGRHSLGGNLKKRGKESNARTQQFLQVRKEIKVSFDDVGENFEKNLLEVENRRRSKTAKTKKDTSLSIDPDYETDQSKKSEDSKNPHAVEEAKSSQESKHTTESEESSDISAEEEARDKLESSPTMRNQRQRPTIMSRRTSVAPNLPPRQAINLMSTKNANNPFSEEVVQQPSRNAPLKYSAAIFIYFQGDMKTNFHIHSMAPQKNRVEISHKIIKSAAKNFRTSINPITADDEVSRLQLEQAPEWECAQAIKLQGDIFRIVPACDHNYIQKVRKVVKTKKQLDANSQFKYGEYIESLNEEIKYNLELFEQYKQQYVQFGTNVMLLHENSRQFLKIKSPNMTDQQFQFRLKLAPHMSEKTIFKLLPSNKLQQEGDGHIHENDQFFLAYTYDKILNKNLFIYADPDILERQIRLKQSPFNKFDENYTEMIFSEDKKLPLHFGLSPTLEYDRSENLYKHLNGKVIQIKHIESELLLTMTIKRKANRILNMFFGDKNRYSLNEIIEKVPDVYGPETSVNIHFEPRSSINTYWKVFAPPSQRDVIYLENAVSKVKLLPLHLQSININSNFNLGPECQQYYKLFREQQTKQKISFFEALATERKYIWVEYLKFNKAENQYEFSKFGKLNDEDLGSLFDSFKIVPVDLYKQHCFEFISNTFRAIRAFDCYQADEEEIKEYEDLLQLLKKLKKFIMNKLSNLINVEEDYGKPNLANQTLVRESFIIDELMELMDNVWPDESFMRKDFSGQEDEDSDKSIKSQDLTLKTDVHQETKMSIAEKIFDILRLVCVDNLQNKEFVFYDIVPRIQKFFGVGFRKEQDYRLIILLVKDCDKYADYKEKTKYSIIFQFIKKLFRERCITAKTKIFSILREFCINSKGEPNNYHQKLLHDLLFYNKLEGISLTLKETKTSYYRSTVKTNLVDEPTKPKDKDELQVQQIQKDLKSYESQESKFLKSKSLVSRNQREDLSKKISISSFDMEPESATKTSNKLKLDLSAVNQSNLELSGQKEFFDSSRKLATIPQEGDSFRQDDDFDKYEEVEVKDYEFIIKHIHDLTLDKVDMRLFSKASYTSNYVNLVKLQLYFYADLCYLMSFDCQCSQVSQRTVSNLLNILTNQSNQVDNQIKAGITRILNTLLRNHDDNIIQRPYFLRLYEKQEFHIPHKQDIISEQDVRTMAKFTRDHFYKISTASDDLIIGDYDSEVIRLTQYLIQSNLVFIKDFQEGYNYVTDIFESIARMHLKQQKAERLYQKQTLAQIQSTSNQIASRAGESSLNVEDFQKQFKKMKKLLQMNLTLTASGMIENPIAWKMLNLEKHYTSFVAKVIDQNQDLTTFFKNIKKRTAEEESARLEMVKFFQWIVNLRIDHLISNTINMFHTSLENILTKEELTLDQLINNPERLTADFISKQSIEGGEASGKQITFFDAVINMSKEESDASLEYILDIDEMYQEFYEGYKKYENNPKIREGYSSPISKAQRSNNETEIESVKTYEGKTHLELPAKSNMLQKLKTVKDVMKRKQLLFSEEVKEYKSMEFKTEDIIEEEGELNVKVPTEEQKEQNSLLKMVLSPFNRVESIKSLSKLEETVTKQSQRQTTFLDLLIDIFIYANDSQLQQETIKAMYRFMNVRRELLSNLHKTILIFRSNLKVKIENLVQTLRFSKLIIQDSTIWEIPTDGENPPQVENANVLDDVSDNLRHATSQKQDSKKEYAQKMKDQQKAQHQVIQGLAFTKSNKPSLEKIEDLDQFLKYLNEISDFFTPYLIKKPVSRQASKVNQISNTLPLCNIQSDEEILKQNSDFISSQLAYVQPDLQYAFLAISGHEILLDFMKRYRDIRSEVIRIIFFNSKDLQGGRIFTDEQAFDPKLVYSIKILLAYKKCYEILIKFVYNNKTNKQVLLNYIDDILLFNSEYYMQSKMTSDIYLFDCDLLNHVIVENLRIKDLSNIMIPKMLDLVQYIQKIIEFPKKPFNFAPMILKTYSNIIANCENTKVNDLVVDLILKEESFFQIQGLLLGSFVRKTNMSDLDHFFILEKFMKVIRQGNIYQGISAILKIHNIRMIKKKFYQMFKKKDELESYFTFLKKLLLQNFESVKQKLNSEKSKSQSETSTTSFGNSLTPKTTLSKDFKRTTSGQSASLLAKIEEEITDLSKRFILIESYLIHVFYKLFFEIKGTQKQLLDKVEEMKNFLDSREKDIEILESYVSIFEVEEWPQYQQFNDEVEICRRFCLKHASKNNAIFQKLTREFSKVSAQSHSSIVLKQTMNMVSNVDQQKAKLEQKISEIKEEQPKNEGKTSLLKSKLLGLSANASGDGSQKQPLLKQKMSKMLSAINQTQIAQKKEQIFKQFKWRIIHDENLKLELKKEVNVFSEILLRKFKHADIKSQDIDSQKYHIFFTKLVEYSQMFNDRQRMKDTKHLVEIFSRFIDLTNEGQSYKGEGFEAKTVIQEKLYSIGAVQMVLEMMCSEHNEMIDEIFPQLLYFSNRILDGAGNNIQAFFTEYLTKQESAINLFERCYHLIEKDIQQLQKRNQDMIDHDEKVTSGKDSEKHGHRRNTEVKDKTSKAYDKEINVQKQILKFFKNLCENHNTKMQLLVGNQGNPEKNFDMVSLTVNYLHSLISNIKLSKRNYSNAQNCCISLAEYVQGPCFVNQNLIKDANFYNIAIQILSIKPNLHQDKKQVESVQRTIEDEVTSPSVKAIMLGLKKPKANQTSFNLFESEKQKEEQETDFDLSNFMIQKLKLNCTIILLSLLEQRSQDDPLLLSMKRTIPIDIIKQNIIYEYFLFCKDYNKFLSRENFFRHVLTQSDYEVKEELIIEVGFNLYFLLKRWSENKKTNDSHIEELMAILNQNNKFSYTAWIDTIKNLFNMMSNVYGNLQYLWKLCFKKNRDLNKKHKRSKLERFFNDRKNLVEALHFFKNNSASIDCLVKNSIEQVYFPYMPYCTYLSDEEKVEFYNSLPTDRDKEKIEVLVNESTDLTRRMRIEYEFKKFFNDYPLIGPFVYYTELWKSLAYYTTLSLNFMNLYSFTAANDNNRLYSPMLFGLSTEFTNYLYSIIGIMQIMFAIFIDCTIVSKRLIYHYQLIFKKAKDHGEEENNGEHGETNSLQVRQDRIKLLTKVFEYILSALSDFQLLYYTGYLIFSFFGYFIHPFFYSYHMIDMIIRNPYLKNVLKAVYRPRYELFNTFVMFLCLQYIFALLAYIYFDQDYGSNECTTLYQCFMINIDQTFKAGGGIGGFLEKSYPKDMDKGQPLNMARYLYDNLFNVILVILVVEIISGIIIDTFGALREEHNKITDSIENKCMICGKNRDQIEREYQDQQAQEDSSGSTSTSKQNEEKAFEIHKRERHNIYDYIFFLAYLQEKPELEYTGLESYVFEKFEEENNTWFPIYKVGGDKSSNAYVEKSNEEDDEEGSHESNNDEESEGEQDGDKKGSLNQKKIFEVLIGMNEKIEFISEQLGIIQDNEQEEETTRMTQLRKGSTAQRPSSNEWRRGSSITGTVLQSTLGGPQVNIGQLGVSQQTLAPPQRNLAGLVRQNSNTMKSARVKLQAVNAFMGK